MCYLNISQHFLVSDQDIANVVIIDVACTIAAISVIVNKNPIYSVLFLICLFSGVALHLIISGLTFIGLSYLLVYVGAVSILFLFILMLINIKLSELKTESSNTAGLILVTITIVNIIFDLTLFMINETNHNIKSASSNSWESTMSEVNHISNIGDVIYTVYCIWLIIASLILLLSMVGAIIITIKGTSQEDSKTIVGPTPHNLVKVRLVSSVFRFINLKSSKTYVNAMTLPKPHSFITLQTQSHYDLSLISLIVGILAFYLKLMWLPVIIIMLPILLLVSRDKTLATKLDLLKKGFDIMETMGRQAKDGSLINWLKSSYRFTSIMLMLMSLSLRMFPLELIDMPYKYYIILIIITFDTMLIVCSIYILAKGLVGKRKAYLNGNYNKESLKKFFPQVGKYISWYVDLLLVLSMIFSPDCWLFFLYLYIVS